MPHRPRLTHRFPVALTGAADRGLRRFAADTGLDRDQALSFLCENLGAVTDSGRLARRLRQFRARLAAAGPAG